jgi:hypothetical protein
MNLNKQQKAEIAQLLEGLLDKVKDGLSGENKEELWRTKAKLKQLQGTRYECRMDDGTWTKGQFSFDGPEDRYRECTTPVKYFAVLVRDEKGNENVAVSNVFSCMDDFLLSIACEEDIVVIGKAHELKADRHG